MKKHIANIITGSRIVLSLPLLFIPLSSAKFYILYLLCGFTDMIDGTIARKTGAVSDFGSKLDTVSDFVFLAVVMIKLLPIINLPTWLWVWIFIIAFIKVSSIILSVVKERRIVAFHSVLNKITGACLFVIPLLLSVIDIKYSGGIVCAIATTAALQELFVEIRKRATKENSKTQEKRV